MTDITPERLSELLTYDPASGVLTWKRRPSNMFRGRGKISAEHAADTWNTKYAGNPAMTALKSSGHNGGPILGHTLMAHRVAWAIHYGRWPSGWLDHINGIRNDNRIANLREASAQENAMNRRPNAGKQSGLPHGVSLKRNKRGIRYFAQIQKDGQNNHLGFFDTPEAAHAAYVAAATDIGFHENHGLKAYRSQQ